MSREAQERRVRAERLLAAFHDEADVATQKVDWQMVRDLLPFARPQWVSFVVAFGLMPLVAATSVYQPRLLQRAVDAVGGGRDTSVLAEVSMLFGGVILLRFFAQFAQTYTMQLAGQRTMAALRARVFAHIQRLSIRHFDRTPVGRIVTRVTNDIDSMSELFASGAVTAIGDILLIVGIIIAMLLTDWRLSLIAFAVLPPLAIAVEVFRRLLRVVQRTIRARVAQLNAFMNEQVQGIHVVQAFGREAECADAYDEINASYRDAYFASIRYDSMLYSVVEALSTVCIGLVLWYAAQRIGVLGDPAAAEAYKGTFVAFYAYINQFFIPVRDLSTKYTVIQSSLASAERVFGLLGVDDLDAPPPSGLPEVSRDVPADSIITFEDVHFSYKDDAPVLKGVSLTVARGETVAVVGATGAGKTTVTALAQRFYDVNAGAVLVHGRDVRSYERDALRAHFAMVQQDVFLFSGTVLANISYGDDDPDAARARDALERVGAWELFQEREGLETEIVERGANLSAGERQLIAFARALYRDPDILILDEATANIDSETEARLQGAVETLLAGRTAIVIAHRLSTIQRADRILVFHRGRIVEQGDHAALIRRGGVYARLHSLQFAGSESHSIPPPA